MAKGTNDSSSSSKAASSSSSSARTPTNDNGNNVASSPPRPVTPPPIQQEDTDDNKPINTTAAASTSLENDDNDDDYGYDYDDEYPGWDDLDQVLLLDFGGRPQSLLLLTWNVLLATSAFFDFLAATVDSHARMYLDLEPE